MPDATESPWQAMLGRPPEPGIESAILAARVHATSVTSILPALAAWPLIALSTDDYRLGPEHLKPLVIAHPDGTPLIALFTSPDRVGRFATPDVQPLRITAGVVASGAGAEVGIVVNPETEPTLLLPPQGVAALRAIPPSSPEAPVGSRALSDLELAIIANYAGKGSRDAVLAALPAATLYLASETDPSSGAEPRFAVVTDAAGRFLAAWTDPGLVRQVTTSATLVKMTGRDIPNFVGDELVVRINPGTAFDTGAAMNDLRG